MEYYFYSFHYKNRITCKSKQCLLDIYLCFSFLIKVAQDYLKFYAEYLYRYECQEQERKH